MDALLLLLQLRNSLSEFGPAVIRPLPPLPLLITISFHMQALRYLRACSLTKHEILHELLLTITISKECLNTDNYTRLRYDAVGVFGGGGCYKQESLGPLTHM